jgi:hypothetical protein
VADIETGGFCVELRTAKRTCKQKACEWSTGSTVATEGGFAELAAATAAPVKGGCGWQRQPRTSELGDRKTAFAWETAVVAAEP